MSKRDDDFGAADSVSFRSVRATRSAPIPTAAIKVVARPSTPPAAPPPVRRPAPMTASESLRHVSAQTLRQMTPVASATISNRPRMPVTVSRTAIAKQAPAFTPNVRTQIAKQGVTTPANSPGERSSHLANRIALDSSGSAESLRPNTSGNATGSAALPEDMPQEAVEEWQPPDMDTKFPTPADAMVKALAPTVHAAPILKESFWTRLLALFGIKRKAAVATMGAEPTDLRSMTESVVRRARNGDQNAMALIALVRDNARKGDAKAQAAFILLNEYVRCNPVGGPNPRIGNVDTVYSDAVALSHGPLLTNDRIKHALSSFGGEQQAAVRFGMMHTDQAEDTRNPRINAAIRIGKILGHARKLQAARMPGSSLSKFDANVGWELGE